MHTLVSRLDHELVHARFLAQQIRQRLIFFFLLIDELCAATCRYCPEPCCLSAKVWIDFQDLLFLHLSGQQIPATQLIENTEGDCCYLGYKGCVLPRIIRPWICTRYLCPPQMTNLRKNPARLKNNFDNVVNKIKTCRGEMENEFIRVISSCSIKK